MFELLNEFIPALTTTAINLTELGIIMGIGIAFFKGISWIINTVKEAVLPSKS